MTNLVDRVGVPIGVGDTVAIACVQRRSSVLRLATITAIVDGQHIKLRTERGGSTTARIYEDGSVMAAIFIRNPPVAAKYT